MARTEVNLTDAWQELHGGPCTITVKPHGAGYLYLNSTGTDVAADKISAAPGDQFMQLSATAGLWAKAEVASGWVVIVDTDA